MFNYGDFYCTSRSLLSLWTEYYVCEIDPLQWKRHVHASCAKEGHQYQENYLLHFNSILINYKLVLEELDVLGEEYERPARSK